MKVKHIVQLFAMHSWYKNTALPDCCLYMISEWRHVFVGIDVMRRVFVDALHAPLQTPETLSLTRLRTSKNVYLET